MWKSQNTKCSVHFPLVFKKWTCWIHDLYNYIYHMDFISVQFPTFCTHLINWIHYQFHWKPALLVYVVFCQWHISMWNVLPTKHFAILPSLSPYRPSKTDHIISYKVCFWDLRPHPPQILLTYFGPEVR